MLAWRCQECKDIGMGKISQATIDEYRKMLAKNANSKVFAPLAEALRENGAHPQAEKVALEGIRRHPNYVGGYVALGRTLSEQGRSKEALPVLKKAAEIDPQNLLALHLLGNTFLQLDMATEALRTFKMVLFLNPLSEKAKVAVRNLENISAEDYEDDVFQYQKISPNSQISKVNATREPESATADLVAAAPASMAALGPKELDRKLSLIDALIIRNDLIRAREALIELNLRSPNHPEITRRFHLLEDSAPEEDAADLHPLQNREWAIFQKKKTLLENLLRRVNAVKSESIAELS